MSEENEILDNDFISNNNEIYENASIIRRYCNGFIDSFVIIFMFGFFTSIFFPVATINDDYQSKMIFTMYFCIVLYYFIFEYLFKGRTIGKFITKTKVINKQGNPPTLLQVIKRILTRYMPLEYFTILTRKDRTTLHDGASGTRVIKISRK